MNNFLGLALLSLSVSAFAFEGNEERPAASKTREELRVNKAPIPSAQTDEYLTKRDENSHLLNSGQKYPYKAPQSRYDYSEVNKNSPRGNDYGDISPKGDDYR